MAEGMGLGMYLGGSCSRAGIGYRHGFLSILATDWLMAMGGAVSIGLFGHGVDSLDGCGLFAMYLVWIC